MKKVGEEGVETGQGVPLHARTRMSDRDLVRVNRYYLETGARPGSGRAAITAQTVSVIHGTFDVALHVQPIGTVRLSEPVPPLLLNVA